MCTSESRTQGLETGVFEECAHSFLQKGTSPADGRWLEHLLSRLWAGSGTSCCLTSPNTPGCCCLLQVTGREHRGGR